MMSTAMLAPALGYGLMHILTLNEFKSLFAMRNANIAFH